MLFESSLFVTAFWKRMPFLRLIAPLLVGITVQLYLSLSLAWWMVLLTLAMSVLLLFRVLPLSVRFSGQYAAGLCWNTCVFCGGAILLYMTDIRHQRDYFANLSSDSSLLILRINAPLEETSRSYKTTAVVKGVYKGHEVTPARGILLLSFSKDSIVSRYAYGDILMVSGKPELIKNSGNPGGFDYRQYCAYRGIYHQLYLKTGSYGLLPGNEAGIFQSFIFSARNYCISSIRKYIGNGPEAGMAEALLIGYRRDLDQELVQLYSNTGIVHIIAISGMHLALLYGTLLWLLKWLPSGKYTDALKAVLVLIVLWGFTLLTGASASVLRSAVMFTCITLGELVLRRHSSIFNTLAASAFVLLCSSPYLAVDAGFQLSYLAVLSILLFYKPLYAWLDFNSKWQDTLWQLISVSLAAQLLTLPVSLYYFHQFPNYFLLANLIAVPLSTVIIYGEIMLLLLSPFGQLAGWLGWGLRWLIRLMNICVEWLGKLPGALIQHLYPNILQTVCMYLLIGGVAIWVIIRWKPGIWLVMGSCMCMIVLQGIKLTNRLFQQQIVVYNITAYTAIDFVSGGRVCFAGDDSVWLQPAGKQLQVSRSSLGVKASVVASFAKYGHYIQFGSKRIVIIDSALPASPPQEKFSTDYLLITHNPRLEMRQLVDFYRFNTVILAASNSPGKIRKWKNDCYVLTLRCFSVPDQGAYVINF
ncbi:MAG TPA: ComEC/Rec2 family competence protein [Chitinophaga sp.]|uniref:ComEC/Rec2 family competence protein n=1 Tax=Chitinophaga sp. TaxID=1869181 RepID=UPI002C026318|nr:ComEC/Rec2 family competence protein [Chitinophaga sp.]HVI47090.1 ComEC/Rec2 family competence protein [Chitinophaga sp.]